MLIISIYAYYIYKALKYIPTGTKKDEPEFLIQVHLYVYV